MKIKISFIDETAEPIVLQGVKNVEVLDSMKFRKNAINKSLANFVKNNYTTKGRFLDFVIGLMEENGFSESEVEPIVLSEKSGGGTFTFIDEFNHSSIFLTVTWYQMPSGNYEFVAYV